jgi:thioester reductase-like protein
LALSFSKSDLARHKVRELVGDDGEAQTILSNGQVYPHFEIKIVDPETRIPCPSDRVGEIWLKGPGISPGYWNKAALNERIFRARLAPSQDGPYFRTGDLGFIQQGDLFISGRLKEMIIIRGKNFFPQDIESAVAVANPVLESGNIAVCSVDVDGEEHLVVVAECEKLKTTGYSELIDRIRESVSKNFGLQAYAVALIKRGTMPRTSTLKTRRRTCRDRFLAGELGAVAQWARDERRTLSAPSQHRELISLPQDDSELESFIAKKIASVVGVEPAQLDLSHSLPSYGLDSLGAVELSHFLETTLNLRLGVGPLYESETIASVIDQVKELWHQARSGAAPLPEMPDLLRESDLPSSISFSAPALDPSHRPVFLTGATGFVGGFLLDQLLKTTETDIVCLVRGKNIEDGARRIRENLACLSLWRPEYGERIRPVLGDISKPALGLSPSQFEELAENIGSIHHCAANVNFIFSYWDLKPTNVTGTLEVIRLAGTKTTKPLHYISTVGIFPVWGNENGKAFKEGDPISPWQGHFSGYAQSKWVAERLVHQAKERGLPTTVYRVGEVIGHSETGICKPEKDAYSNLIKGALMMGEVPHLNLNIYFAPVDMVAKGVVYLSGKKESIGRTFHLFLNPIEGDSLVELLNSLEHKLGTKSYPEFLQDIEELNHVLPHNPLAPFMPLIRSSIVSELSKTKSRLKLDSKATLKELKKASIPVPPVHQAVKTYLNYLQKTGFLD